MAQDRQPAWQQSAPEWLRQLWARRTGAAGSSAFTMGFVAIGATLAVSGFGFSGAGAGDATGFAAVMLIETTWSFCTSANP